MQSSITKLPRNQLPESLLQIAHPPRSLYVRGQLPPGPMLAVVGSRTPTKYGLAVTAKLVGELARAGVVIVSGLAYGIDAAAHQATLDAGGITVAVLAGGLDSIYPSSNRTMAERIISQGGALVSEYPAGTPSLRYNFPARNRLIAGLSQALLVTEAAAKSGAVISANFALDQNRQVLAVPGHITSSRSAGPNNLLKRGATPVTDAIDVLNVLNINAALSIPVAADSAEEAQILALLSEGPSDTQDLIDRSGLAASRFASIISLMEITGKVRNLGAGQWARR